MGVENTRTGLVPLNDLVRSVKLIAFDFDGVFTDNTVYVMENGTEAVRCWRGDGLGLRKLERAGVHILVISTETNPVVSARSRKLNVRCIQSCHDKLEVLRRVCQEMGLRRKQVAFVGNDINDLECLEHVGFPIVVRDAHPDVVDLGRYLTTAPGGRGAVREICDLFLGILGRT